MLRCNHGGTRYARTMSLRHFAAAATVGIGMAIAGSAAPAVRSPNVLMIAVGALRPQLGCYGDPIVRSPYLDRLAARGVVFERACCQQALCSPSRISLMAGRRVEITRILSNGPSLRSTMPDAVTLPQLFESDGWFTCSLGKVCHVGIDDPNSWSVPSWQPTMPRYGPEGQEIVRARRAALKTRGAPIPERGPGAPHYGPAFEAPEVHDDEPADGDTARQAVETLRELAAMRRPFFLAVGFLNPHVPWVAPKKYWDLYRAEDLPLPTDSAPPVGAPAFAATTGEDLYWYTNVPADRRIPPEFGRRRLHGYLAAINYVDALIGRIFDELGRLGLETNTIVTVWGDHGDYMGGHG